MVIMNNPSLSSSTPSLVPLSTSPPLPAAAKGRQLRAALLAADTLQGCCRNGIAQEDACCEWPQEQIRSAVPKSSKNGDGARAELALFPGEAEELIAEWPHIVWEIAGVRAYGAAFLSNFRFVLHADHADGEPLDVGLADVRCMHLEVPLGAAGEVELVPRGAKLQHRPAAGAFVPVSGMPVPSVQKVAEVVLHCRDLRVIRLLALQQESAEPGANNSARGDAPSLSYDVDGTADVAQALDSWMSASAPSSSRTSMRHFRSRKSLRRRTICGGAHYEPSDDEDGSCTHRCGDSAAHSMEGSLLGSARWRSPSASFPRAMGRPTWGWSIGADVDEEFFRLQGVPRHMWRLAAANSFYALCDTYPSSLVVPADAPDDLLAAAADARARGRFPVLTYYHKDTKSALLRCSQPRASSVHGDSDREYLELCRRAVHANAGLTIFDCRSYMAAFGNKVLRKGGQEDPRVYTFSSDRGNNGPLLHRAHLVSLDVPNIHEMNSSWRGLKDLVEKNDIPESKWLQRVGETQWLDHCRRITEAAVTVAKTIGGGVRGQPPACVVVHCSDGWDRTAQVCALAQLLADRRFRTRSGFCALVEKDWRRFGHPFRDRAPGGRQAAPIFLQWLFCIGAVVQQFPDEFEFTSTDLMLLADLVMSGATGTLGFNSEREAELAGAANWHTSLWAVWCSELAGADGTRSSEASPIACSGSQHCNGNCTPTSGGCHIPEARATSATTPWCRTGVAACDVLEAFPTVGVGIALRRGCFLSPEGVLVCRRWRRRPEARSWLGLAPPRCWRSLLRRMQVRVRYLQMAAPLPWMWLTLLRYVLAVAGTVATSIREARSRWRWP